MTHRTSLAPTTFKERLRRAKARLTEMNVQEVSLVDAAANLRRFVIVKRNEKGEDMADKTQKVALKLPTEAKQGLTDGIGQVLDKLTALATMVGEAEADDQAIVPTDLGMALNQSAEMLEGLATQYAASPPADEAPPPDGAPPPDAAAAPPPDGAAGKSLSKALPAPLREGDNMTPHKDPLTLKPKTMSAFAEVFEAVGAELQNAGAEIVAATKAGRKISGSRYKKLSELHTTLGSLLNELAYDEANEAAEGKAKTSAKKADDAAPPVAKSADVNPLDAKLDKLLELTQANTDKLAAHDAAIAKINRTPDAPRAREVEGDGASPSTVAWPTDMSAAILKRKAAR